MAETGPEAFLNVPRMSHEVSHSNKNTRSEVQSGLDSIVSSYDSLRKLDKTK